MTLFEILLSALLSVQSPPTIQYSLVDLTGDCIKEHIFYYRSYSGSGFCQVSTLKDSTYTKLWEIKFKLNPGQDYRLFTGFYDKNDEIPDLAIEIPQKGISDFYRWDKEQKKIVPDTLSVEFD